MNGETVFAVFLFLLIFIFCLLALHALFDWEWKRGKRLTWREIWNLLITGRLEGRVNK